MSETHENKVIGYQNKSNNIIAIKEDVWVNIWDV